MTVYLGNPRAAERSQSASHGTAGTQSRTCWDLWLEILLQLEWGVLEGEISCSFPCRLDNSVPGICCMSTNIHATVMHLPTVDDDSAHYLLFWVHLCLRNKGAHEPYILHGKSCQMTVTVSGQFALMLSLPPSGLTWFRRAVVCSDPFFPSDLWMD